ncbi:MAG: hypothetical protein JSS21_11955 [Proteobacteria bacterium]|nr:hypothetical protein [Pseudomonadota bacterium]
MQDSHARLIEGLPSRSEPDRARPASARAVREQVAHLPLANPAQAAREITEPLEQMLTTRWSGSERVEALEAIRVPVAGLCEGLEQQLGVESHPLPPAKERLVETASGFHRALARNYAVALHELCAPDGKLPMFKSKAAAVAAVRALHHLGIVLQWCYRLYRTPPEGTWRRAHALHAFAAEIGVADKPVADPLPDGAEIDADQAYTHALLLALSNPYRFSSKELREAWLLTRAFAPHCAPVRQGGAGIAVDENSDEGPGYVPEERAAASEGILSLDLVPLKRFLEEHAALQPPGTGHLSFRQRGAPTLHASIAFLHRLRSSWTGAAERGFARVDAEHALDAVIGLHAVHHVLAGNADFGAFMQRLHGNAITIAARDQAAAWAGGADGARPQLLSGQVLDQSLGGYRLRLRADGSLRIRVGEVIGLAPVAEEGEPQEWMAGLIRWLRTGDDGIYAGVELLARRARAAGVRLSVGGDGEMRIPQRALLVPDRSDATLPALLVAHLFDTQASDVEVAAPADPADWTSSASVHRYAVAGVEEISSSYYRVVLAEPEAPMIAGVAKDEGADGGGS